MLPRGTPSGKGFSAFVMVEPFNGDKSYKDQGYYQCATHLFKDQPHIAFPFDRPIHTTDYFKQPNMFFKDIKVYHKMENEINTAYVF